jgi:molecular chaperone DnaJ
MQPDPYLALGVSRSESASGIRTAFRGLARHYHPDRRGPGGVETFREIADAYALLSDPSTRTRYDATSAEARRALAEGERAEDVLSVRDGEDLRPGLEPLFARVARNFTGLGVPKGERVEQLSLQAHLTREQAERGALLRIGMPVFRRCSACSGLGSTPFLQCARCLGAGLVEATRPVAVRVSPGASDGSEIVLSLVPLGVQNFYACVRLAIDRDRD